MYAVRIASVHMMILLPCGMITSQLPVSQDVLPCVRGWICWGCILYTQECKGRSTLLAKKGVKMESEKLLLQKKNMV